MERIKIGGYVIGIVEDDKILANDSHIGEYSSFEQLIKISPSLTKQQKDETLIHEVLEAINDLYELDLNHDEQLCKLSVVIHQILTDNKKLLNVFSFCER